MYAGTMENIEGLKRLSEVMKEAKKPSIYAREFMKAAERKEFRGIIVLAEKIQISKNNKNLKPREIQDFAIINSEEFKKWHRNYIDSELNKKGLPTYKEIIEGDIDIDKYEKITEEFLSKRKRRNEQTVESIKRKKERLEEEK